MLACVILVIPPAEIPVRLDPSIAGKAPVRLGADKDVRLEPSIAGKAPVRLGADRLVRLEPLIDGKEPVRLAAGKAPVSVRSVPVATGKVSVWLALLAGEAKV
tara:strand:- start:69 stop:377 length:309 start_codon:yes stop_codon:yes gene_type:complete